MKVTEKDVARVADLANLELSDAEQARLLLDLNSILGYIDRLNLLDTANVPPMASYVANQAPADGADFAYAERDDVREGLRKSLPGKVALQNAPASDGTFFRVPKVIER